MYFELSKKDFAIIKDYFKQKHHIPAVAVINGLFPGRIFVDDRRKPKAILVWAISRWAYVYFEENGFNCDFINSLLEEEILPVLRILNEKYFEIYAENNVIYEEALNSGVHCMELFDKHYENTHKLDLIKFSNISLKIDGVEITEQKFSIIPDYYKEHFNITGVNKEVYGITINRNEKLLSKCINNGFEDEDFYFIDLDTFDSTERNKGYGALAAYELIKRLNKKGLKPLWETTEENYPSQRVAQKLGFEKLERYPVYIYKLE